MKFISPGNKPRSTEYTDVPDNDAEITKPWNIPSYRDTAKLAKNKKKKP